MKCESAAVSNGVRKPTTVQMQTLKDLPYAIKNTFVMLARHLRLMSTSQFFRLRSIGKVHGILEGCVERKVELNHASMGLMTDQV